MFTTIVVGTDGSETAGAAVAAAIDLAARLGARLDVVSAYEPSAVRRLREAPPETPGDRRWAVNLREEVDATLREAAGRRCWSRRP